MLARRVEEAGALVVEARTLAIEGMRRAWRNRRGPQAVAATICMFKALLESTRPQKAGCEGYGAAPRPPDGCHLRAASLGLSRSVTSGPCLVWY